MDKLMNIITLIMVLYTALVCTNTILCHKEFKLAYAIMETYNSDSLYHKEWNDYCVEIVFTTMDRRKMLTGFTYTQLIKSRPE